MFHNLEQHHIGCLVESIEEFKEANRNIWTEADYSKTFSITAQDVKVCFLNNAGGIKLELVEPGVQNKPLRKMLDKGISYYHLAFISKNYEKTVEDFRENGWHQLSEFLSEAFCGRRCCFFYHPQLKLIELIEDE